MENTEKRGYISKQERLVLALIFGKIKNDLEKVGDIDKLLKKVGTNGDNSKLEQKEQG